uniref:Ankyrin repeat domain-containing protein 26 n=1 Tax=Varanus komodoensis TaxID=61221 RepID=A0A8D2LIQ5_VARKO
MKKMKKILRLGRKRKEQQPPPPSPARCVISAPASCASPFGCAGSGSYKVRSKELGKLHRAAAEGDIGELRQLLQKHDLNEQDRADRTPLHFACASGYTDIVTFLVDNKCELNICDKDKRTPLMKAVQCQQEFCVAYLLEHGADPSPMDINNNTALHFAASNSSISIAKHLLEHNVDLEAKNKDGSTPLILAVTENNREMVEFLLEKGASVHATDKSGRTALLIAASNKRRDLTNVLLLHGSDVFHRDESGWSADDYAMISDDPILIQYIADYSKWKNTEDDSPDDQKVLSVLSSPEKAGDTGITLGAPATNKEVIDDHSSGDSVRDSRRTDNDSWLSSEEEELDFSPKKPQKPSLAQLMNVSQQLKKNIDEKSSIIRKEHIGISQHNKSDIEAEDLNGPLPQPLFQVKSFPHPIHSSPGSFSKPSQMTSYLDFKQEESSEDQEEEKDDEEEEEEEDGEEENQNFSVAVDKHLTCKGNSQNPNPSQDGIVRKASSTLGMNEQEEQKDTESPWDSECTSESPRKPTIGSLPISPAKMHSITEEPCNGKSDNLQPKTNKANWEHDATSRDAREKQKSDLMEELGLDAADDIEDASDWDSTSISLKSVPCTKSFNNLMLENPPYPLQLAKDVQHNEQKGEFGTDENKVEEGKRKWELEAEGRKETADIEKKLAVDIEQKTEQKPTVNENQHIKLEGEIEEESQIINRISSPDRKGLIPIPCPGKNLTASVKDVRKGGKQRRISKQRINQQIMENLHQLEDDSSLSEVSPEEAGCPANENKIYNATDIDNDFDDFTQSSDTATEDIELPTLMYKEAVILIEQLSLDSKDSVSLQKIQNIFHGYERLIEHEKGRYTQQLRRVKKLEKEKKEQQRTLEEMREMKSMLEHQKVEWESDISSLKFSLKEEEEKRVSAEMLYEKSQEQLRKKEEQYCKQLEEKQQLELTLRSLEMELRTLKKHLKQVEEERNETQRQLSQEQNARALQEGILSSHLWKQKELEEESKRTAAKHSEITDSHDQEKELFHKNQILQDELSVLRLELDHIRIRHQEEESKYLEENETLKERTEELKKELKLNEEALTQTVFQYNGQINVSKTEVAILTSKLEHIKENKERLEVELDSFRSRLNSTVQELERCQLSKNDLERMLQRERDEWLRSKEKLDHDLCALRETNNSMSQQLSKAESKANSLENELHHVTHSLREKSLLLESIQRDLSQAQGQVKELENVRQVEKDQINKYAVKQESMQERLAQLQSENLLLRQQFEDFQNKGIIKEKVVTDVQDRFSDIFSKLRADTEKQVQMIEERNKELITKCNDLREQIFKYETEKMDREGTIRQLQQELADSLKKQSMSEASLEVSTRYRIDLEEDKQQLQNEIDKIKAKLNESEEQYLQSERLVHDLRNSLDAKEHESSLAAQKLQDLLVASSGANNTIKQLEEHIQRLEIENARLEATTNQQTGKIEILQKDLKDSVTVHSRLEELITGLQTTKINLEEQLNHQVQKQTMLSVTAQDTHNMWEEELKSRSKLGIRLSELEREKTELMSQLEIEKKKVKKLVESKRSMEIRLEQEMIRSSELQKECNGIKKLLKTTKKKVKEYESGESSSQTSFHGEIKNKYSEIEIEVGKLRTKVNELSHHLEVESSRCTQLESINRDLHEQLSSMKILHRNHEKLERSKVQLEEEVANLKRHVQSNVMDLNQVEQYKRDIEERARQEIRQKLEEVNLFLQTQAASQETLEQIRATSTASLRNQLENRIRDLESELAKLKSSQQDNILQKESTYTELERYKGLYSEELKMRKSLGSKLDRANEKLAEANAKLFHERHKSKSLLANSFINGSLSSGPVLETVQLGNIGNNLALNRPLSLGGGFMSPPGNPLASKNRVEAYLAKLLDQKPISSFSSLQPDS